jgi:hypothetical protein
LRPRDPGRALDFKEGEAVPLSITAGAGLAFFALIGFEDSVNLAEEARDPSRSYPRALFGGLLTAGVIYVLVSLAASMVVPTGRLAVSDGPLLEVVQVGPLAMEDAMRALQELRSLGYAREEKRRYFSTDPGRETRASLARPRRAALAASVAELSEEERRDLARALGAEPDG